MKNHYFSLRHYEPSVERGMGIDALESWEKSERDVGKVREEMYRKEGLCQVE